MRISDAKAGDFLVDRDGDVWFRTANGAELITQDGTLDLGHLWLPAAKVEESFGPFVRLVPEKEGNDAK